MFVFPGIGLGSILSRATQITQSMIYASATALSSSLTPAERAAGWLYPDVARIRDVSVVVAAGVIRAAQEARVDAEPGARGLSDKMLEAWIRERMYDPFKETEAREREVGVNGMEGKGKL